MVDEYRRVLHEWARRKLGDDTVKVTRVDIMWDKGGAWSSYTLGALLQALFKIAAEEA